MPKGINAVKLVLIILCLAAFGGAYGYAAWEVWDAGSDKAPDLNQAVLFIGAALGSVLGTYFTVAMGVKRGESKVDENALNIGETLIDETGPPAALATLAVVAYAVVGIGVGVTVVLNPGEAPEELQALAAAFGGYVLAVFGSVFNPGTG